MKTIPPLATKLLIYLLLGIALVFVLIVLQQLLVPVFFAVLFAYLVYPAATWLEPSGVPRILANLFLIGSAVLVLGGASVGGTTRFTNYLDNLAEAREQLENNVNGVMENIERFTGYEFGSLEEQISGMEGAGEYIITFFTATTNTVVAIGLIPVYTFLLLLYRTKFKSFLNKVIPPDKRAVANNILDRTPVAVPQYLTGLIVVVSLLVVINSLAFWAIGIEYALVIGLVAALWNLIPYLGTIIGFAFALLMVLATQSSGLAFGVFLLFFPIQFTENNILTPNIAGSYVQLNPMVIILSLIAAAMMWGLAGMLLVIPYLAMIKIVCENVENLQPIAYLLGTRGTEEYLPSVEKIKKWFAK